MKRIKLVIDNKVLDTYTAEYFKEHPRARKPPIKQPYHESMNVWMIMKRPAMNALKGRWKTFIKWFVEHKGYTNLGIDQCELEFVTYYGNNRDHDIDNSTPKFIIDGLRDSGMIVDDNSKHITKLSLECFNDVSYPRTEIYFNIKKPI